jgi:hypothetical protein
MKMPETNPSKMSDAERLATAVLLFHKGGQWTDSDDILWEKLVGSSSATSRTLCDFCSQYSLQKGGTHQCHH